MAQKILLLVLFIVFSYFSYAQSDQIIIKGIVLSDDTMQPLPFAHIIIDSTGTTSNIYGAFTLKIAKTDTLHFSYIGYKTKLYTIPDSVSSDQIKVDIILLKDIKIGRAHV